MEKSAAQPPSLLLFKIPFVTTSLITDIILYFVLIPIWMILGITQLLGPALMIILLIKLLLLHAREKRPLKAPYLLTSAFVILMLSMLLSGLHIRESYWTLVFLRNIILYLSAFCLLLIVYNACRTKEDISRLITGLTVLALIASLLGILVIADILPLRVIATTPINRILPKTIAQSEFFEKVIHPDFGDYRSILGWRTKRLSSIFISPNLLAAALIMILPLQFFLWNHATKRRRLLLAASIPLSTTCLFFTYSRGAAVSLPIGFLFFLFLKFQGKLARRKRIAVVITGGILLLAILGILKSGSRFVTDIKPRSDTTRILIFQKSIESLRESPVFGWGTQRNMEVVDLNPEIKPLGSHSTYLAYLYRYGLSGFLIFALIYALVFMRAIHLSDRRMNSRYYADLGLFAGWAFVNNVVQSMVTVMDYDVSILLLIWMIWGLLFTAGPKAESGHAEILADVRGNSRSRKEIA